jgi:hypothetical protein
VIGKGWTAILEVPGVTPTADAKGQGSAGAQLGALMNAMTPVQGAYGSGRLLRTRLVSVLLLDDGRMFVGAVAPAALERAAAQ